jgi:DegV family protein with EDD domain
MAVNHIITIFYRWNNEKPLVFMSRVRIITDSSAYLPDGIIEKYAIEVIPQRIKIGNAIFEEAADFAADHLFAKLNATARSADALPDVLSSSQNAILETLQSNRAQSEQILAIHTSGELSPVVGQVRRAAEMLKGRYNIRVIDSMSIAYGLRLLVEQAAQLAHNGASLNELARITNGSVPHIYLATLTESLNYLERSTQLSASQSLLGALLGIKAMLMMEEGKLSTLEKVQTRDETVDKLYEFVQEFAHITHVGIFQHGYERQRSNLLERLKQALPKVSVETVEYSPSLAAYVGPNTIGVFVYEGNR